MRLIEIKHFEKNKKKETKTNKKMVGENKKTNEQCFSQCAVEAQQHCVILPTKQMIISGRFPGFEFDSMAVSSLSLDVTTHLKEGVSVRPSVCPSVCSSVRPSVRRLHTI